MTPTELLLPELYRQTPEDVELQRVLAEMMARVERDKDFTLEQLFPSTTSGWGLELWERAWGIPIDRTQSDERRRARIWPRSRAPAPPRWRSSGAIAQSFSPYRAEVVEEAELYRFVIW